MDFTYDAYRKLVREIIFNGYEISTYHDWHNTPRSVILRHDVDNDLEKALTLARVEKELGVRSTYFVLITSDFYNVFSATNSKRIRKIIELGHEVGLHFDELRYPDIKTPDDARKYILEESKILSAVTGSDVKTVSMHRPSRMMLDANLVIPGMINSYGEKFFKEFKYLSDSRRRWREPVEEIVMANQYNRIQVLTHAFWYNDTEMSMHDTIYNFINSGNMKLYLNEKENISDLESIMSYDEVR